MKHKSKKLMSDFKVTGIKLLGIAVPKHSSTGAYLVLKIRDLLDKVKIILMPAKNLPSNKEIRDFLSGQLFFTGHNKEVWEKIYAEVRRKTKTHIPLAFTPGFCGTAYILPNNKVIGSKYEYGPYYDPGNKLICPVVETRGTLEDWKNLVAQHAVHSSRLVLVLCAALSGYIIRWSSSESGGFHLFDESSRGKSTCIKCAVSVTGPRDNYRTCSFTLAGIEAVAAGHNNNLLVCDETKELDPNKSVAAEKARKLVYMITGGRGKTRSLNYQIETQQQALKWLLVVLSGGELSLADTAKEGGTNRISGEEVRVVDVPANANCGMGVFESLPNDFSTAADFAKFLDRNSERYYGTAQAAFLERFTAELDSDSGSVEVRIRNLMETFIAKNNIDCNRGIDLRIAERFALAFAAGVMAVDYGVLPLKKSLILKAMSKCCYDAMANRPETNKEMLKRTHKDFMKKRVSLRILDLRVKKYSKKKIADADGYKVVITGVNVIAIRASKVKVILDNKYAREALLKQYKEEGLLLCDAQGKTSRKIRSKVKERCYCFVMKQKVISKENIPVAN